MSRFALRDLFGCLDADDPGNKELVGTGRYPTYGTVSGGTGFERARGTFAQDGSLMAPSVQEWTWMYAPELLSFLGHHPQERSKRIDDMNGLIEEGVVVVSLVKGGNKELEKRIEMAQAIPKDAGYTYDPIKCSLRYEATTCFLGCVRILDARVLSELEKTGYWSRHDIAEWGPTDAIALHYANDKFGPAPSQPMLEFIRAKFLDLWNTEFETVNSPPPEMLSRVVMWYNNKLMEIKEETERPFAELFSSRDDTDIAQLLTASCLDRLSASREVGDRSPVERLVYSEQDVSLAKAWLEGRFAHLRGSFDEQVTKAEAEDGDKAALMLRSFIRHLEESSEADTMVEFHSRDLIEHFVKSGSGGESTARRHLRNLKKRRIVVPDRRSSGNYHIDDSFLESMGYRIHAPVAAPEHEPDERDYIDDLDREQEWEA
jgi:hypothetical protein